MAIISIGRINKKLLLILFLIIVRGINRIAINEAPPEYYNSYICAFEEDLGTIIAGIIINFLFRQKQKKIDKEKRGFKYIILLFFLVAVKIGFERTYFYVIKDYHYNYFAIISTTNGFEIILMSLATFLILNYKYYIHHMITMIIYCILGIIFDLILGSFSLIKYNYIYIFIIFIINEILIYCYLKYMMDKLYYQYIEIILYYGIFGFIAKILIFSGQAIYEHKNGIEGIIHSINNYFMEAHIFSIIFFQFIYFLVNDALFYVLIILIMYYLRPNYLIISDQIDAYFDIIFYQHNPNRFYTLIPFAFQIFSILFYFEILELNFCDLNKNTAKNIQMREEKERKPRYSKSSEIELDDQYYLSEKGFNINNEE